MNTYLVEIESVKMHHNYVVNAEVYFKKIESKTSWDALLIAKEKFETAYPTIDGFGSIISNSVIGVYLKTEV